MKHLTTVILVGAALLVGSRDASAQRWGRPPVPASGACFYEHINYGGQYFCVRAGESNQQVPRGSNDRISSIRVFGSAEVTVYRDNGYRGTARRFGSNMSDLGRSGWNDRISSFQVRSRSQGGSNWGGAYGGGNWNGQGNGGYDAGNEANYGGAYGAGSHGGWNQSNGGRWTYQQAEEIVRRAYRSVLLRDPDPGARTWVDQVMRQNLSQQQLEAELRKSDEYRNMRRR